MMNQASTGIWNASKFDSSLGTLDGFIIDTYYDLFVILKGTHFRCKNEATVTIGGNIEVIIIARDRNS